MRPKDSVVLKQGKHIPVNAGYEPQGCVYKETSDHRVKLQEWLLSNAEASIEWIISICLPLSKFYVGVWSSKYMRMTKLLGDRCHAVAM